MTKPGWEKPLCLHLSALLIAVMRRVTGQIHFNAPLVISIEAPGPWRLWSAPQREWNARFHPCVKEPAHKSKLWQGAALKPPLSLSKGCRRCNCFLVLWPYENVPFGNVAWASRPTLVHWIEHLHPVTDREVHSIGSHPRTSRAFAPINPEGASRCQSPIRITPATPP